MNKLNTSAPAEAFVELESGLIVPSDYVTVEQPPAPKAMDFFAGAGGMSCGFHQAGWHVIAASEWEPNATCTYLMNLGSPETEIHFCSDEDSTRWDAYVKKHKVNSKDFGSGWIGSHADHSMEDCKGGQSETKQWFHETYCAAPTHRAACEHFFFGDIRNLKCETVLDVLEMELGELDCIAGGPPCQGFSITGKQNVMDPRNSLVFEFCRMIVGIQPKTMVFENVPGILNMVTPEGLNVVDAICLYLSKGGYSSYKALKKSLGAMPGAKGAVRRTGQCQKDEPDAQPKKTNVKAQMEMSI